MIYFHCDVNVAGSKANVKMGLDYSIFYSALLFQDKQCFINEFLATGIGLTFKDPKNFVHKTEIPLIYSCLNQP